MLTQEAGQSSRDFPLQVPTGPKHKLWLKMIHSLTQAGHRLLRPLGRYIGAPYRPDVWFLCETLGSLCLKVDLGGHDVYTLNQTPCSTRYGTTYNYSHHNTGPCSKSQRAPITNWLDCTIKLHSLSPTWSPLHVHSPNQLLATLASWENQSLWKHLRINGSAGDWIFSRLMRGSLMIDYEGSYMPTLPITTSPVLKSSTAPTQTSTRTSPGWRGALKRQQTITVPRYWGRAVHS
jgi:hypothetical protein